MKLAALPFLALTLFAGHSQAADAALAAVESIGRLNGIALACQQPALVARTRNAIVTTAAKTRDVGETFEKATNAAYLAQGQNGRCPDAVTLAAEIEVAEARLLANYGGSR